MPARAAWHGRRALAFLAGDPQADRAVPPTGFTAWLTLLTAGAMAFLAVFALALALATDRLADRWGAELAQTATLRLSAPGEELAAQTAAALRVLEQTPGVAQARALTPEENQALLEPWLGPDLPLESLPVPQLVEITLDGGDFDAAGLRARLEAEVPGAVLDDHTRWRAPLIEAAGRLRGLGVLSLLLIAASTGAMITLAAQAALAANAQVIRVLRLVGARDIYIARAFVRRFTLRAAWGAGAGTLAGIVAVWLLPSADTAGGFLTGLGFQGAGWLAPLLIPVLVAVMAFAATRAAALRSLRAQS
ncbi:cell division protein FtsX [Rubellimicrobium roseum]|uniref:Cell division protein FtsX n=1 Tax=Rubellimicrobium roseum TaxID=687525 RepID=A0A5C4NML3_9RHOB|nr:cell division protein FtsX [Rubellimicrobium roseum]